MNDEDVPSSWTIEVLSGGSAGYEDGTASQARFRDPKGLLLVGATLYVADSGNHVVRAIDLDSGIVSTIAGSGEELGFAGDDLLATEGLLFSPSAVGRCNNGDLFVADTGNNRVRRIEATTDRLSTVIGDGVPASSGEGRPATLFPINAPLGVACDTAGNLFVTSTNSIRLLPADESGIVDGTGPVLTIYGAPPRDTFPQSITKCLTGIVSLDEKHVQVTDACAGILLELELVAQ